MNAKQQSLLLTVVAKWASELDTSGDFAVADDLDGLLQKCVDGDKLNTEDKELVQAIWRTIIFYLKSRSINVDRKSMEDAFKSVDSIVKELGETFSEEQSALDDGLLDMGINNPMNPTSKAANMKAIEISLLSEGMYEEALLIRTADLTKYVSPQQVADSVRRVVIHLMHKANIQDRAKYINSIRRGLVKLNPVILSEKKSNPASAIGAAVSMIKNLLTGQRYESITAVISELHKILG